jgi:NAD(P)-dependent dehydrogenase (short-subunit alcohol dehydrogenase family)
LRPLEGRVALVTGASRGIGRASALALGAAGAKVIAVARVQGALEELDDAILAEGGSRASLVPIDLTDGEGIDRLGLEVFQRHKRLDILVHAAAMLGGLRPASHIPPALWDKVVAANLTAVFRLIRSFEPLLRVSDMGRSIFLTSGVARGAHAFWGAYAATKAGMEGLVRCWADEVESSSIRAVLLDPGAMRTAMRAQAFPGEDPATLVDPAEIGPMILDLALGPDPGLPTEAVKFSDWRAARAAVSPGRP